MTTRRNALAALGVAALAPALVRARARKPVVAVLRVGVADDGVFTNELASFGWVDGRNVTLDFGASQTSTDTLPQLAAAIVARGVDVIVASGDPSLAAAKKATSTIPIVGMSEDLVGSGFVQSMSRPGGNITGVSILAKELDAKRLEVLREILPRARRLGVLHDPAAAGSIGSVTAAGRALGVDLAFASAGAAKDVEASIGTFVKARAEGVNVLASIVLYRLRARLIAAFASARLPSIFQWADNAAEGALIGYGPDLRACRRQHARVVDRILRGARPADISIEQPTKIELVINLKTAKALGITIPQSILLRADKVIE